MILQLIAHHELSRKPDFNVQRVCLGSHVSYRIWKCTIDSQIYYRASSESYVKELRLLIKVVLDTVIQIARSCNERQFAILSHLRNLE